MITKLVNEKGQEIPIPVKIYSCEQDVIMSMRTNKHIRTKILKLVSKYLIKLHK